MDKKIYNKGYYTLAGGVSKGTVDRVKYARKTHKDTTFLSR
jgi:hypothetical protein